MPTFQERNKTLVDGNALLEWLSPWDLDQTVIEWVHAMPRQGVSSSFSFGRSTGAVETVARCRSPRTHWVAPALWKKHFGLSSDKGASLDKAKSVFGDTFTWAYKTQDGIAEAALMTRWYVDKHLYEE